MVSYAQTGKKCLTSFGLFNKFRSFCISAVATIPIIVQKTQSFTRQAPHIGFGIYLDWENILAGLNADETLLLKNPSGNETKIIKMFNEKLYGGTPSDDGKDGKIVLSTLILHPNLVRFASSFLDAKVKDRGVCRHKATILYEILNKLGIKSQLRIADAREEKSEPTFSHVFVYIPEQELIADPMNNIIEKADEYRKSLFVENEHDFDLIRATRGNYAP